MKKFTLLAAIATVAATASAQYTCETPYADQSVVSGSVQVFDILQGNDVIFDGLQKAGQKTNDWRLNNDTRNLWFWEETLTGGDGNYPGVGYDDLVTEGYPSATVTDKGWSGAGFSMSAGAGINNTHWTDNTKFHIAFRTETTGPASVAIIIADGNPDGGNFGPAKVALGAAFNDNGSVFPTIGPRLNSEWQAIDISFGDLKKLYPAFNPWLTTDWTGNLVSFLGGGVQGENICLDAIYFHTPQGDDSGVKSVAEEAGFVISSNTVNVSNGQGIELYDLSGRLVKSTANSTMGIEGLGRGAFIVKSGNSVVKIMK